MLQVATINCHFRLPSTFSNLHNLFATSEPIDGYQKKRKTVDIYCINLQQLVYRGKRTFFSDDVEQAPGRAWRAAIPAALKRANEDAGHNDLGEYICVASCI